MLHLRMARLATVENLCKTRPAWFIQKPKARARCSGLIAVCPEISDTYDGDGRRVKTERVKPDSMVDSTTTYVYGAGGELVQEYGSPVVTAGRTYLTGDALGSTRLVTKSGGDAATIVSSRHDYLPFGEEINRGAGFGVGPTQKFTGKERDGETGLDYFGARYMSAAQGRFSSPDPLNLGARTRHPQTWNMYAYALNNPLRYVDPSGKWSTSIHEAIIDKAFPGLSAAGRDVLKRVSESQDRLLPGQSRGLSYQHSMRAPWETPAQAQVRLQTFAKERLESAQYLNSTNTLPSPQLGALEVFGELLHAEVDGTSPAHEGFQVWQWGCPFAWMGCAGNSIMQHTALETTISPERMDQAVRVAQKWFLYTFGGTAYTKAITDPEADRKKGQANCLKNRETGQCVQ